MRHILEHIFSWKYCRTYEQTQRPRSGTFFFSNMNQGANRCNIKIHQNKLQNEIKYRVTYAPSLFSSARTSAESWQSLRCPSEKNIGSMTICRASSEGYEQTVCQIDQSSLGAHVRRYNLSLYGLLTLKAPVTTIVVCFVICLWF